MSVRVVHVRNPLAPADGRVNRDLDFQPGRTMRDYLLEVFSVEQLEQLTASLNGTIWARSLWTEIEPRDGDFIVAAVPLGNGGVWRTLAQVGVMAAAVVAGAVTAGAALPGLGVLVTGGLFGGGAIAGSLAAGLVSIAGNILVQTFLGATPSQKAQTPSYAYDGPQMLARPGAVIPKGYGTFMWGGNCIDGFTDIEGQNQYVNALICFGFGPARSISGIQINGKDISTYQNIEYWTRLGTNDQLPIPQFNRIVNGYPQDVQVTCASGPVVVPGTGTATQALQVDIEFPTGVYYVSGDGNELPCAVLYKVEYSVSGANSWQSVLQPNQTHDIVVYNGDGSINYSATPKWVVVPDFMPPGSGIVLSTDTCNTCHYVGEPWTQTMNVTTYNADGTHQTVSRTFSGEWQLCDPTMNQVAVDSWMDGWVRFVADSTEPQYNRTSIYGLTPGKYDVRVTKYGSNNADNTIQFGDFDSPKRGQEVWIHNVNEIQYQNLAYPNMILLGIRALATNQINGTALNVTAVVQHGLRTKDEGILPAELLTYEEDNPACVAADMMLDTLYGGGQYPGIQPVNITRQIDQWVAWANLNDELVDDGNGNSIRRHVCNGVFDSEENLWSALGKVTAMSRAAILPMGLDYGVFVDQEDTPVQMFTMGNIIQDSYKETWIAIDDRANQVEVQFADSTRQYRQDNPVVYIDPADQDAGVVIKNVRIDGWGITVPAQAWHFGRFKGLCTKLLLRIGSFQCDVDAVACRTGNLVYLQHDVPQWGWGGRTLPNAGALANTTSIINVDRADLPAPGTVASDDPLAPTATAYNVIVLHPSLQRYAGTISTVDSTKTVLGLSSFDGANRVTRAIINGTDCAIIENGPGTITIEPPPGFVAAVDQAYLLFDTDVMEVRGVKAILPGGAGVPAQLELTAPLSQVPQDFSTWLYGPAGNEAKIVRVTNVKRASEFRAQIEWIDYDPGCYVDATPTVGEVSAVVTTDPGVTGLTVVEGFQLGTSGSYTDYAILNWANGKNTAGVAIYGWFNGQAEAKLLERLPGNQTSWRMQVREGYTWNFKVVGFDANDNYAAWKTAPQVQLVVVGVTQNLLQDSSFQSGFTYWNLTPRAGDTLVPTFQNDGEAQYTVVGSALTGSLQQLLNQVIVSSKWSIGMYLMLSAYFETSGTPTGNLVAELCFYDATGTLLGVSDAVLGMTGTAQSITRVHTTATVVPASTAEIRVRLLLDGTINLPVGTVLTMSHLLLEVATAGQTVPSAWADIDANGKILDVFTSGSSTNLRAQGSTLPTFAGSFPFLYTDTTLTLEWQNLEIFWPDTGVTEIPDGNIPVTGLTASTDYYAYLYYDIVNGGIKYVVPANPVGSPAIVTKTPDPNADAACRQDGRVALTPGGLLLSTGAAGSSGAGGGYGGITVTVTPSSKNWAPTGPGPVSFTATVTGTPNTGVVWATTNGSIDQSGNWTPPGSPGTHGGAGITATSVVNGAVGGASVSW